MMTAETAYTAHILFLLLQLQLLWGYAGCSSEAGAVGDGGHFDTENQTDSSSGKNGTNDSSDDTGGNSNADSDTLSGQDSVTDGSVSDTGSDVSAIDTSSVLELSSDTGTSVEADTSPSLDTESETNDSYGRDSETGMEPSDDSDTEKTTDTDNMPIEAVEGEWTWIDFPDSRCRDGSSTGIGVNLSALSPNVFIFLNEGGACFESMTCALNDAQFGESDFNGPTDGIFDRTRAENPVADWSFVLIPYCTGDVHTGNNPSGIAPRVSEEQQYVGYDNLNLFLDRLVPTFSNADHVLFAGASAGGFGALMNAETAVERFSPIPVTIVSDSAPPMSSNEVPSCLQSHWRTLWGLDNSVLGVCGEDCPDPDDYMIDLALLMHVRYPGVNVGLISSTEDYVIRQFFSTGADDCAILDPSLGLAALAVLVNNSLNVMTGEMFSSGLYSFRQTVLSEDAAFGTFFIESTEHIWSMSDAFFSADVNGVTPAGWLSDLLSGTVTHVGP